MQLVTQGFLQSNQKWIHLILHMNMRVSSSHHPPMLVCAVKEDCLGVWMLEVVHPHSGVHLWVLLALPASSSFLLESLLCVAKPSAC